MRFLLISLLLTNVSYAGIYVNNLWTNNSVEVCFAKGEIHNRFDNGDSFKIRDWSEENKNKVKSWINSEYVASRTGIHFTGWKNCEDTDTEDVVLFYNSKSLFLTALFGGSYIKGRAGSYGAYPLQIVGYPEAQNFIIISSGGLEKGSVVHEFGHIAGLGHEHIHPDAAINGKACKKIRPSYSPNYRYTPYDQDSIMSYCSLDKNKNSLSKSDIKLLKKLYP